MTLSYSMAGVLTLTEGSEPGNVQFEVYDFPRSSRYTAVAKFVTNTLAGYNVGDIIYCRYDVNSTVTPNQLTLACNAAGDTALPDMTKNPLVLTK